MAEAGLGSFACVESGIASAGDYGVASVRASAALVSVGAGGVAIAWAQPPSGAAAEPRFEYQRADAAQLQAIQAGEGGLIIAFQQGADGRRRPIVGFVGDVPLSAQGGLRPGVPYRLSETGRFVPA